MGLISLKHIPPRLRYAIQMRPSNLIFFLLTYIFFSTCFDLYTINRSTCSISGRYTFDTFCERKGVLISRPFCIGVMLGLYL
jgi:hypothetical protein